LYLSFSMKSKPFVELKKVEREFTNGDVVTSVLRAIDLKVDEGEFVAIMGPSGSGKSTIMHIIGFLDHLSAGEYYFKGKNVAKLTNDELAVMRRDEVGFVFQFFNLLAGSTVLENVSLPMIYAKIPKIERKKRAIKALKEVGMEHRLDFKANTISGGERQRVAIARALVNEPGIICADEPTGNLDTNSGLEVLKIFQKLNDQGRTIIMVTHEEEAAEFAKRIVRVRDGEIVSDTLVKKRRTESFRK